MVVCGSGEEGWMDGVAAVGLQNKSSRVYLRGIGAKMIELLTKVETYVGNTTIMREREDEIVQPMEKSSNRSREENKFCRGDNSLALLAYLFRLPF